MVLMEKKLTKKEIKYYKMTERELFKTFYDYDEDSLSTKSNKTVFVKNTIMKNIIKNCKGGKKEVQGQQRVLEKNYLFQTMKFMSQ